MQTLAWFLNHVHAQLGTPEQPMGSNQQPYGVEFGWNGVAWCAEFGWCMYHDAGIDLPIKSASCVAIYDWAAANGFLIPSTQCQPGDSLIRTWTNKGRNDPGFDPSETHYQIVTAVSAGQGYLTGGNQGPGVVSRDQVTLGESSILGGLAFSRLFTAAHPPATTETKAPMTKSPSHPNPKEVLGLGSQGSLVKAVQQFVAVTVDGQYGHDTQVAVQHRQHGEGMAMADQDGIVGPITWASFIKNGLKVS